MTTYDLTEEQQAGFDAAMRGESFFLTGSAGTGKSHLIRAIVSEWRQRGMKFEITASSGTGAVNIGEGAMTLHHWLGLRLAQDDPRVLLDTVRASGFLKSRWFKTKRLIIDEISMVDPYFFALMVWLGTEMANGRLAGGLQIIVSGDFFQLPPIDKSDKADVEKMQLPRFAFQTAAWKALFQRIVILTIPQRQADRHLFSVLEKMREGVCDDEVDAFMHECMDRQLDLPEGVSPIKLFPRNEQVQQANRDGLSALRDADGKPLPLATYMMSWAAHRIYRPTTLESMKRKMSAQLMVEGQLHLRVGAKVVLLANLDVAGGLANGTLGVVVGFCRTDGTNIEDNDEDLAAMKATRTVPEGYLPEVRFSNGAVRTVGLHNWKETERSGGELTATQIPLKLGYGMSVHKSMGLSMKHLEIDLRCFEKGQGYVAASRCCDRNGLKVTNYTRESIFADPLVKEFYAQYKNGYRGPSRLEALDDGLTIHQWYKIKSDMHKKLYNYHAGTSADAANDDTPPPSSATDADGDVTMAAE